MSAIHCSWLAVAVTLVSSPVLGDEFDVTVPMHDKGMATYYVNAQIADLGISEFMVDTGSGYLTINEQTLSALQKRKQVQYVKELRAILANGTELVIPVYSITELRIGTCTLRNVEAAVFPAHTRQILGLSALNKAAPFTFSVDPPELVLSNCAGSKDALLVSPALAEAAEPKGPSGNGGGTPLRP
ncbi:MAG: retropepsin-like aspartic protease [Sulfuricaulis sp.]|uniref:retropepsin-like aspartic protease family protein n=1 Tax=Sulfuricaulis sp. TaxID=2003553 RepID=UPI003C503900